MHLHNNRHLVLKVLVLYISETIEIGKLVFSMQQYYGNISVIQKQLKKSRYMLYFFTFFPKLEKITPLIC